MRQELCKRSGILLYAHTACTPRMEALKTALQDGSPTIAWSVVHSALEQQRIAARNDAGQGPQIRLESVALWKQFFAITNEMIVTKAGR